MFTATGSCPQWPWTKDSRPVCFLFFLDLSGWGGSWANAEDSAFWTVVKAWTKGHATFVLLVAIFWNVARTTEYVMRSG